MNEPWAFAIVFWSLVIAFDFVALIFVLSFYYMFQREKKINKKLISQFRSPDTKIPISEEIISAHLDIHKSVYDCRLPKQDEIQQLPKEVFEIDDTMKKVWHVYYKGEKLY